MVQACRSSSQPKDKRGRRRPNSSGRQISSTASANERLAHDVAVGGIQLEAFGVFLVAFGIVLQGLDLAFSRTDRPAALRAVGRRLPELSMSTACGNALCRSAVEPSEGVAVPGQSPAAGRTTGNGRLSHNPPFGVRLRSSCPPEGRPLHQLTSSVCSRSVLRFSVVPKGDRCGHLP